MYYDFSMRLLQKTTDIYRCYHGHLNVIQKRVHKKLIRLLDSKSYEEQKIILRVMTDNFPMYLDIARLFWQDINETTLRCLAELVGYDLIAPCVRRFLLVEYRHWEINPSSNLEEWQFHTQRVMSLMGINPHQIENEDRKMEPKFQLQHQGREISSQEQESLVIPMRLCCQMILDVIMKSCGQLKMCGNMHRCVQPVLLELLRSRPYEDQKALIEEFDRLFKEDMMDDAINMSNQIDPITLRCLHEHYGVFV